MKTNSPLLIPCSCGEEMDHDIARATSEDGQTFIFWASGMVTTSLGFCFRGVGSARTATGEALNRRAAELVKDVLCFYRSNAVGSLVVRARRLVRARDDVRWYDLVEPASDQ